MANLIARMTRGAATVQCRHVRPVPPAAATGLVARIYAEVERDFGMLAPPVALHSPAPQVLAACWLMLRETLLAEGTLGRRTREVVATGVSLSNSCPYCVDVHGSALTGMLRDGDARAVGEDRPDDIGDPELRAIDHWARRAPADDDGRPALSAAAAPELLGVAVTFHYLNRMVNIFLPPSPLPPLPAAARRVADRVTARLMGGLARRRCAPGASLGLLPAAPAPADLAWADGTTISAALARAYAAVEEGGRRAVPERVRDLVLARLADWDGEPSGISSRSWLDEALVELPVREQPAGRLALLTAFASYQVTDAVLDGYRRAHPGDARLIECTAWASLMAARRAGALMQRSGTPRGGGEPASHS
ncbi:carboxymuconolactone decarboxylase family protein [Micromonospora chersina]|uniref:carboxymuconolactone decarboxylase family protein n=1 Tax=Micromonospora chersina TaxID=47854 RepID=UPI0033F58873